MIFRTEHPIPKFPFHIGYEDTLFFIGSCFSDHIGTFFSKNRFQTLANPFGTIFNPKSIFDNLNRVLDQQQISDNHIYFFNDQFISFSHQGKIAAQNKQELIQKIDIIDTKTFNHLSKCSYLFITFGTSFCYRFLENNLIVANCHKIPNHQFEKLRLSVDEIVDNYKILMDKIKKINPSIKIIFTVSPVRHLSDGFHENQLSKSILHLAIDQLVDDKNVFYFPAYEVFMDDLRDYRFYASDLCHPGEQGIQYMEEMIRKTFFNPETELKLKQIEKEIKSSGHIPLNKAQ
jgi:hypothetical protein